LAFFKVILSKGGLLEGCWLIFETYLLIFEIIKISIFRRIVLASARYRKDSCELFKNVTNDLHDTLGEQGINFFLSGLF